MKNKDGISTLSYEPLKTQIRCFVSMFFVCSQKQNKKV